MIEGNCQAFIVVWNNGSQFTAAFYLRSQNVGGTWWWWWKDARWNILQHQLSCHWKDKFNKWNHCLFVKILCMLQSKMLTLLLFYWFHNHMCITCYSAAKTGQEANEPKTRLGNSMKRKTTTDTSECFGWSL